MLLIANIGECVQESVSISIKNIIGHHIPFRFEILIWKTIINYLNIILFLVGCKHANRLSSTVIGIHLGFCLFIGVNFLDSQRQTKWSANEYFLNILYIFTNTKVTVSINLPLTM